MTYLSNIKNGRTHVLQENFCHSNHRFGAAGGLQHERQLLVEEQRLCKARARKLFLETNRRRKALEEKRRQMDIQDQLLQESVLQQRRQRIQDATERFQKGHLPPSQRQTFRKNVPTIEDALSKIQGTLTSHTQQLSFLSSNPHIVKSSTPFSRPSTVYKPPTYPAVSAVEAFTKLLQEQSLARFKNRQESDEMQFILQEKQLSASQNNSESCTSESPLSKDSLEMEDLRPRINNQPGSYLSFMSDTEKSHKNLESHGDLHKTSDLTESLALLLDDGVAQSENPEQKKFDKSGGIWNSKMHILTPSSPGCESKAHSGPNNCNLLMLCEIIDAEHFENSPKGPPFFTNNGNCKELLYKNPLKASVFSEDSKMENNSQKGNAQQTGQAGHRLSSRSEPCSFINNLNNCLNSELKFVKANNTAQLQRSCSSNLPLDVPKCFDCTENKEMFPLSAKKSHSAHGVRLIKGILKKTKCMPEESACASEQAHLIFAKQVALAIRDSVELTKVKAKVVDNSIIRKKLRWFDGVQVEEENKKPVRVASTFDFPQSKKNSEDLQLCLTAVSGAYKAGPSMTSPVSSGYHLTKKAWTDVGVQVSLAQPSTDEVKVQHCTTVLRARTVGPQELERECSTRAVVGSVSAKTRKGTIIRPQSAIEVNQIAKTQRKLMVPHPPPRTEAVKEKKADVNRTACCVNHDSVNGKQALAKEQIQQRDTSLCTHHLTGTHSTVMYTPLPPSLTHPSIEATTKGKISSGHLNTRGCRRSGAGFNEKGLCLDSTPTDEEISQLWHSIRSVFATKEALCPYPLHQSEGQMSGLKEEFTVPAVAAPTPGTLQQRKLNSFSLEEQKILLSLDRLNHRLHCVQEQGPNHARTQQFVLLTKEMKVTNPDNQNTLLSNRSARQLRK